jgi:hypothetical protein
MPGNDPLHQDGQAQDQERVPAVDGDTPGGPGNGFRAAPLSRPALGFLKQSLARRQRRRAAFQAQLLRVCVDGEARWQVDARGGVGGRFRVSLGAVSLEVFGDDAEGELLLAMVPLPRPEVIADGGTQHLWLTLEGGQTVAIDIALDEESGGQGRAYVIQLAYADAGAVATQGAQPLMVEAIRKVVDPAPSASVHAALSAFPQPHNPLEARLFAEAQLFAEVRRVQAQAKELFAEIEKVRAQAEELRKIREQTSELRTKVQHNLQRLRELCQKMPWVHRGSQEQDRQDPGTPHQDAP